MTALLTKPADGRDPDDAEARGRSCIRLQDYTLVAVIAVAAHLCGSHVSDHHFIAALAQRFSQDTSALQQVCSHAASAATVPAMSPCM